MIKTWLLALAIALPSVAQAATLQQKHPFVDDDVAAHFGKMALSSGYVHHEELQCGTNEVRFEIEIELPFNKPPEPKKILVTGPDCATARKAIIENELSSLPTNAFKKVRRPAIFRFGLVARYTPE